MSGLSRNVVSIAHVQEKPCGHPRRYAEVAKLKFFIISSTYYYLVYS